jgi:hypothetical protein
MLTAEAHVTTERPSRYLVQLCRHASQMGQHRGTGQWRGMRQRLRHRPPTNQGGDGPPEVRHAECSDTHGIVELGWARWFMRATADTLTLRAEADSEQHLRQVQDLVAGRLERIGRRDHLTVTWQ